MAADAHGEVLRVPMTMMDDLQRGVAASLLDAFGQPAGVRPGFVFGTSGNQSARADAYSEYKQQLGDAWRQGEQSGQAGVVFPSSEGTSWPPRYVPKVWASDPATEAS